MITAGIFEDIVAIILFGICASISYTEAQGTGLGGENITHKVGMAVLIILL